MRACGLTFLILAALVQAGPLQAQADPCLRRIVPVGVVTWDGTPVTDLKAENFKASIHGSPMKILSVMPESKIHRVMFALDASTSVAGSPFWQTYITVADALITSLPPSTKIGLVVFGNHVKQVAPLTEEREPVQAELKSLADRSRASLKVGSKTALWDSIRDASEFLDSPMEGDVIYVLTDGVDNASKSRAGDIAKLLVPRGIRVFSFQIRQSRNSFSPEDFAGNEGLHELVRATGGSYLAFSENEIDMTSAILSKPGKPTKLGDYLAAQHRLLPIHYEIEIETPDELRESSSWKLEVAGPNELNLRMIYPHRLAGCHDIAQPGIQSQSTR